MNPTANNVAPDDQAIHRWYRFVLAYPPHLVRDYLERFQVSASQQILDPFCGTGTTLIECMRLGIRSIGIEANPVVSFASRVKTDWSPDPAGLLDLSVAVVRVPRSVPSKRFQWRAGREVNFDRAERRVNGHSLRFGLRLK